MNTVNTTYFKYSLTNRSPIILKNPKEVNLKGTVCITGIEVNKDGDEISTAKFDKRLQIIDKSLIKKTVEMEMSNHYGWLVIKSKSEPKIYIDETINIAFGIYDTEKHICPKGMKIFTLKRTHVPTNLDIKIKIVAHNKVEATKLLTLWNKQHDWNYKIV